LLETKTLEKKNEAGSSLMMLVPSELRWPLLECSLVLLFVQKHHLFDSDVDTPVDAGGSELEDSIEESEMAI
jgi:hypothetical protein